MSVRTNDDIQDDEDENEFHDMLLDSSSAPRLQICGTSNIKNGTSKDYEEALPQLETDAERSLRRKSHYIVYLTIFIMSIGFSIVLTGVWPYLQQLDPSSSKEFLGWVIAANPLGQMLAAPFLGWCGNKVGSNRVPFIITIALFIVGNALYALLPLFTTYVKWVMVASRFIVGVSSANIAVCRSYIASSTKVKERTMAISITAAAQSMGFILGPGLQTLMAYAYEEGAAQYFPQNETSFTETPEITDVHAGVQLLNMYTLAAWLVAILGVFNLFLFLPCIYKEHNISMKEARSHCKSSSDDSEYLRSIKHDYVAIAVVLFTNFAVLMVYVLIETLIVPMCLDLYAWTPEFTVKVAGLGLTATGVVALFMFLISGKLANMFTDRKVYVLVGLIPLTFAMLVFLPFGNNFPKINNCDSGNLSRIERTTSVMNHFDVEEILLFSNSSTIEPKTSPVLCDNLGCPPGQKWCFYTPIIEIPQFIGACTLTTFGYPIAVALAHAIYSKLIKPTSHGIAMGILTMTGSLSRAFGPIFVTYTYTSFGPFWLFGSLFIYLLFILVINCSVYKRLVPLSFHKEEDDEEDEEEDEDDDDEEEEEVEDSPQNERKIRKLNTKL